VSASPRTIPFFVLALGILASTGTGAGERTHQVRGGESASTIAQQHYGKADLGRLLLLFNGRSSTVIHVGETLRVPYCEIHRVRPGDTWSRLAQRYLGNQSLYPAAALLNGRVPEQPLQVGAQIVMPVVLSHRLERGETLNRLAERFYGDEEMREVLRTFNRIDDPRRLSVGQTIGIPLVTLKLRDELRVESKPETPRRRVVVEPSPERQREVAAPPSRQPAEPTQRFAAELRAASETFDSGDYAGAREQLEALAEPVASRGTELDKVELARLLAFVYVAFDLPEEACRAYRAATRQPDRPKLDEDEVSPKIRDALARCADSDAS
jgi:LysM repeat protein